MKERRIIEIAVFPKVFSVLSFYSKGQYTVRISVVQEAFDGTTTFALPTFIQKKDSKIHESKKASIITDGNLAEFVTEQFYITFNQQTILLSTMAVFKLEHDPTSHSKIYIDFKLTLNKYKNVIKISAQGPPSQQTAPPPTQNKVAIEVDKRRIYINKIDDLDLYKRVIFSECEYFSFLDVFIATVCLGKRVRSQSYQLAEFQAFEAKKKIECQIEYDKKKQRLTVQHKGDLISSITGLSVQEYKMKSSSELHSSYARLLRRIDSFLKYEEEDPWIKLVKSEYEKIINSKIHIDTALKSRQDLEKYYCSSKTAELYLQIYKQNCELELYIRSIWTSYLKLVHFISLRLFSIQTQKHLVRENDLKQMNMVIHKKLETNNRETEHCTFLKRRKEVLNGMDIYEDDDIYHPFMMVENFVPATVSLPTLETNSLVVFVHGYQGSDYDLEKAKNYMAIYSPNSFGLLIKSIQDEIDENLELLGERVAAEIKTHISGSLNVYKKISLVGYSLGGVVARESLKHLSEFKDRLNLLITFASPHLGVTKPDNTLVKTGIWYLINFEKVKNLKQLNCEKFENEEVTLNKLSDCESLGWMKKIVVVSSKEDNFVPHYSSRIDDNVSDSTIQLMAQNIKKRVKSLERMEVWFDVDHDVNTFDKMLGRRAHIEFLENRIFLDMFFRMYGPYL